MTEPVDILYVAFNRLEFTQQSFQAMLLYTDWSLVRRLYVHDDGSSDGTARYLAAAVEDVPVPHTLHLDRLGGPVAAMNWYLDYGGSAPDIEIFAKLDNDMVVCPGWLPEMLRQMELHPSLDILGMEPFLRAASMPGTVHRTIEPCEHIGGKGLLRLRAFHGNRPTPGGQNGYFGFTHWQTSESPDVTKAWINPDLPVFGLDQISEEDGPWRDLARGYERAGWQRLWPVYAGDEHYAWWSPLPACFRCKDTGTVCEAHPREEWENGHLRDDGSTCGGAGMPCGRCCAEIPMDGSTSIVAAYDSGSAWRPR